MELREVVDSLPSPPFVLFVAALGSGVDFGNFLIWSSAERSLVRLHEHREFCAFDPDTQAIDMKPITFLERDGSSFEEPYASTVGHAQAIAALAHWLPKQGRLPELMWK